MIRLLGRTFLFILIFSIKSLASTLPFSWTSEEIKRAVRSIGESINGNDFVKTNTRLQAISIGDLKGTPAVEHLLEEGKKIRDFRNQPVENGATNIFTLIARAIYDGFFETKDLKDAAKYFIWGAFLESKEMLHTMSLGSTFVLEYDGVPFISDRSGNSDIEAAIKALHAKLIEEAEAEAEEKASE